MTLGPVEYASMDRRGMADGPDFMCAPCALGFRSQCMRGCRGHVPGAFSCEACAVPVRSAPAARPVTLTVEQAFRDLERRYAPAWMPDDQS